MTTETKPEFDELDRWILKELLNLETDLRDLRRAARLAERQVYKAVGNLSVVDGKYVEIPDYEDVDLAVFAVETVTKNAKELEIMFDRCFETARSLRQTVGAQK